MGEDASLDDFLDADDQEAELDEGDGPEEGSGDDVLDTTSPDVNPDGATGPDAVIDPDDERGPQSADSERGEEPADGQGGDSVPHEPSAVEPAEATYDWTPGGAACEACDGIVERRWRDEDDFVCGDCKNW